MKHYKRIKEEKTCDCTTCQKEDCERRDSPFMEECPGKPASGGGCATDDNNSKLKGKCQNGYIWDKVHEKCVPVKK